MFFKLAWLNIFKHSKRSLVVFIAVLIAVGVLTLISGVLSGLTSTFLDSILPTAGHIQIKAAGSDNAVNPQDLKYLLPHADELLAQIQDPRIKLKEKILSFPALLVQPVPLDSKSEAKNLGMLGQGLSPDTAFFSNIRDGLVQGSFLPQGQGILISESAAKLLGVKYGGTVMVLTTDRDNNPWYQELKITGLYRSGSDLTDDSLFFVSTATAESLLDAQGMTREIRIVLKDPADSYAVRQSLTKIFPPKRYEIDVWQETFGSLLTILKLLDVVSALIRIFFIIVATSVIANSILMSILERMREHGTLRAIGLKRRQLFAMLLTEGGLLGILGALFGLLWGVGAVALLSKVGVDVGSATEYLGFASRIYPALKLSDIVANGVAGLFIALLSTFYAARVAAKKSVIDALTYI